jgi:outer membrane protein TolC
MRRLTTVLMTLTLAASAGAEEPESAPAVTVPPVRTNPELDARVRKVLGGGGARKLTLARARAIAISRNPSVKNVDEEIYRATALIQRAWAIVLPRLKADASITRNSAEAVLDTNEMAAGLAQALGVTPPPGGFGLPQTVIQEKWAKTFGVSANLTLFTARAFPLIKNAYDNRALQRHRGRHTRHELLFAVARAFYQVRSARELVRVGQDNLVTSRQFLRQAEARKIVGRGTKIDVLRAEIQLVNAEKELENALDTLTLARTALGTLLDLGEPFVVADPTSPTEPRGDLRQLTRTALGSRLDLKTLEAARHIARRDVQDTTLMWVPDLDVTYNWRWMSSEGFSGEQDTWQLIFGARWSLLEGGERIAEVRRKRSSLRTADNNIKDRMLAVKNEVKQSHTELARARRNVRVAEKQLQLAEENHRLVSKQYDVGIVTSLDLQSATNQLTRARIGQVIEKLAHEQAVLDLQRVTGEYSELALRTK